MAATLFIFIVLLVSANLLQSSATTVSQDENLTVKQRLSLINKPAVKSYQTEYGDIFDCVEINKQLAFDHPLLKNHSIQMKPSKKIMAKLATLKDPSSSGIILPKIKCPRGTVPIKRIEEEELIAMEKFTPSMALKYPMSASNFTHHLDNQAPPTEHVATVVAFTNSYGIKGRINTWSPEVKNNYQLSSASVFVASDDGSVSNAIQAGWSVNPYLYQNFTRLNTYWTKNSAKSTGCFNTICPGFIQTSPQIPLGLIINPVSQFDGRQYYMDVSIVQDVSANWWLVVYGSPVGYWPEKLFSSLSQKATRVGWGGEVASPVDLGTPAMGSGRYPNEGFGKACFISEMSIANTNREWVPPSKGYLKEYLTNPNCYNITFDGPKIDQDWGQFMYFGGPPDCKL